MTDRKPDDLYDALRDRLADYGQEPPAQLWAGIRAQLPPPVAQPQLRRRRRWSPVLLMGLLLTLVSGAGWHWWNTTGAGQAATRQGKVAATSQRTNRGIITDNEHIGDNSSADAPGNAPSSSGPTDTNVATPGASPSRGLGAQDYASAAARESVTISRSGTATASSVSTARTARLRRPRRQQSGLLATGTYAQTTRTARPRTRLEQASYGSDMSLALATKKQVRSVAYASRSAQTKDDNGLPIPTEPNATGLSPAITPETSEGESVIARGTAANAPGGTQPVGTGASTTLAVTTSQASVNNLPLRVAVLPTADYSLPALRLNSDTTITLSKAESRWAVQALAGPAQTFRHLASETGLASVVNKSPMPSTFSSADVAYQRARQEQAGRGFGAQVQVRRVLTGRWSLSAGLGYQEYVMHTYYTVPISLNSPPVPTTSGLPRTSTASHRDTYRFATLPVRLGYAMGQGKGRLRYGLLAGADVAVYLGGSSMGTSNTPRNWSSAINPYRPLSLSVSAGLDVRFRVLSRLEILAQPTATYFITSLSKPISGLPPRYLLGGGALVGLSYNLK